MVKYNEIYLIVIEFGRDKRSIVGFLSGKN